MGSQCPQSRSWVDGVAAWRGRGKGEGKDVECSSDLDFILKSMANCSIAISREVT